MISSRHVPTACALLMLALIPTFIHSYSTDAWNDGRATADIPMTLVDYQGTAAARAAAWGKRRFDSDDWMERVYTAASGGDRLRLTVVRSFDAKALYHHPELAITYHEAQFAGDQVRQFGAKPGIPVHVLKPAQGGRARALYALHYDTRFIDNPIPFQLRTAGELLFSRRKPTTLFFVFDEDARGARELDQSPALKLLFAAIDAFLRQPLTSARAPQ